MREKLPQVSVSKGAPDIFVANKWFIVNLKIAELVPDNKVLSP